MLLTKHVMVKEIVTTTKDATIQECMELLFKRHVGSIVIVDNNQHCIGIFTERDAIRMMAQKVPLDSPIQNVMTKNIFTINENATYKEAKNIISLHGIRHLPVTDSTGKLVGLISMRQILTDLLGT
jgi:CBS domain-containing protein